MEPERHRRSLRLPGFDYSSRGLYFVTLCTYGKECLLGNAIDARVVLNEAGKIVQKVWHDLPARFPSLAVDAFVAMPNHIHGILVLMGTGIGTKGAASSAPTSAVPSLGRVLRAFKSLTAVEVNRSCQRKRPLWQRNYYEHIIRGGEDLDAIRRYIIENPRRWAEDRENPHRKTPRQSRTGAARPSWLL